MSLLPIITVYDQNPVLHTPTTPVVDFKDKKLQALIDDMIPTMYEKDGVGLAATQINSSHRIAVITPDPDRFEKYKKGSREAIVLINPTITKHSMFKNTTDEACLSIPDIIGPVKRWNSVEVSYQDRDGKHCTIKGNAMLARVLQHEIDHLDGILFVQRADKLYRIIEEKK